VLAGDRSAKGERAIKNLLHSQFDPVHLVGILFVCQKGWMQIAIAHMSECANFLAGTFQQCAGCVPPSAPIDSHGTVASSRIVVGAMRASEENAARQAVANRRGLFDCLGNRYATRKSLY
jgi:hypothetical protein